MVLQPDTYINQQPKHTLHKAEWLMLFVLVLTSRLLTSIYYIEEPDSLRFALAIKEFDVVKLQPHFPGYPVFCWLAQVLFAITDSMAVSFSIIGTLSIFTIFYSVVEIYSSLLKAFSRLSIYVLVTLLFFNPLMWILSTSYMPDCMGAALVCLIMMFIVKAIVKPEIKYILLAQFFAGILFGTRLSYVPFIIIPCLYGFIYFPKRGLQLLSGFAGIIIWLLPMIWLTGFSELINAAQTHTEGHFNDWGGSYVTEDNIPLRFVMLLRGIWADGLGGYWSGRNMLTLFSSILILVVTVLSIVISKQSKTKLNQKILLIIASSAIAYTIWILLGQNIIYKARHVLPVLPFMVLFLVLAIEKLLSWKFKTAILIIAPMVLIYAYTGVFLAHQHTKPTAISQAKDHILQKANSSNNIIVSLGLVNDYMRIHGAEARLIEISSTNEIAKIKSIFPANDIWYIGIDANRTLPAKEISRFYHNPYVNRMWPVVEVIKL
ncbi:MAG: hypothetical protein ACXWW0_13230 [Bacteroidia bacterium]